MPRQGRIIVVTPVRLEFMSSRSVAFNEQESQDQEPMTTNEPNLAVPAEPGYEFSEQQNTVIKSLASAMRWVGAVMLVMGALQCLIGLVTVARGGLAALFQGAILIVFAVFTYRAAVAFRQIVGSTGQDITYLMTALCSLRNLYRLQVIILGVAALALIVSFGVLALSSFAR